MRYEILINLWFQVAQDIQIIPATSKPSERVFSNTGGSFIKLFGFAKVIYLITGILIKLKLSVNENLRVNNINGVLELGKDNLVFKMDWNQTFSFDLGSA